MIGNLHFLVSWQKDKSSTWSGTCWGLFSALQKRLEVIDNDVSESFVSAYYHKVLRKLHLEKKDLSLSLILRQRDKMQRVLKDESCTIFQFAEILPDAPLRNTFIYQDVSVDFVSYMQHYLPDVFKVSNFRVCDDYSISRRRDFQNEYYKSCSGIFTMGKWLADDLTKRCQLPANKVHHVGGGINLNAKLIDYSGKKGNKILFVGRDFIRKGGEITLRAFSILRERNKNVELYVAGPKQNPLPYGMPGYYYMGDCSHEELSRLFNQCDIFVMPSYFEAYGLVFIEALTYGLPCIGRDAYEMPYFIDDGRTGYLLKEDDVERLAYLMEHLLQSEEIKHQVRVQKEWYMKEYSWDTVVDRIVSVV